MYSLDLFKAYVMGLKVLSGIMTLLGDLTYLGLGLKTIITSLIWMIRLNNKLRVSAYVTCLTKRLDKITTYKETSFGY